MQVLVADRQNEPIGRSSGICGGLEEGGAPTVVGLRVWHDVKRGNCECGS